MEAKKGKHAAKALNELSESGTDLFHAVNGTAREVSAAKKLWLEGNKSKLIKIGVACIVFPDPSPVGEIVGTGLIAAGLVQKGIRKQYLYLGDIKKTFEKTIRDVQQARQDLRL